MSIIADTMSGGSDVDNLEHLWEIFIHYEEHVLVHIKNQGIDQSQLRHSVSRHEIFLSVLFSVVFYVPGVKLGCESIFP